MSSSSSSKSALKPVAQTSKPRSRTRAAASHSHKAGVKWDEVTIAEHDKERGTRTRILEPKTPFRPDKPSGSGASIESSDDDRSSTRSVSPEGAPSSSAGAAVRGLSGRWDEGGDDAAHDEWEALTAASTSPRSTASASAGGGGGPPTHHSFRSSDGSQEAGGTAREGRDEDMTRGYSYGDSGSESGTRPSSSGSEGSRSSKRRPGTSTASSTHSGMHARFADGLAPGITAADMAHTAAALPQATGTLALAVASPAEKSVGFAAKRKAHYSHEFDKATAVDMKALLRRGAVPVDDDDDHDDGDGDVDVSASDGSHANPALSPSPSRSFTATTAAFSALSHSGPVATGGTGTSAAPTGFGFTTGGSAFGSRSGTSASRSDDDDIDMR